MFELYISSLGLSTRVGIKDAFFFPFVMQMLYRKTRCLSQTIFLSLWQHLPMLPCTLLTLLLFPFKVWRTWWWATKVWALFLFHSAFIVSYCSVVASVLHCNDGQILLWNCVWLLILTHYFSRIPYLFSVHFWYPFPFLQYNNWTKNWNK